MADPLSRHSLVWLDSVLCQPLKRRLPAETWAIVADWLDRNRPAIVRRRTENDPEDTIPLGIPLPPHQGRQRIALQAPVSAVREIRPPLTLRQVILSAPAAWQAPLSELDARFTAEGLELRVFGSLAWQHITKESYLTARSDVDLLLRPQSRVPLERALAILTDWERQTTLRADGEVLLPDGAAVAWRELLRAQHSVLVKSAHAVMLRPAAELFGAV